MCLTCLESDRSDLSLTGHDISDILIEDQCLRLTCTIYLISDSDDANILLRLLSGLTAETGRDTSRLLQCLSLGSTQCLQLRLLTQLESDLRRTFRSILTTFLDLRGDLLRGLRTRAITLSVRLYDYRTFKYANYLRIRVTRIILITRSITGRDMLLLTQILSGARYST